MFTRFRTASAVHVFDAPLLGLSPGVPGEEFFFAIGGAYEFEDTHGRSELLYYAILLNDALEQPDYRSRRGVPAFQVSMQSLIEFLQAATDDSVSLYSYERTPSIANLLDAFAEGGGADDWALEELAKKGEKGRKSLLAALKKEKDKRRIMAAISMLLIVFRDDLTIASVQKVIDKSPPDIGSEAAVLLAAYRSV